MDDVEEFKNLIESFHIPKKAMEKCWLRIEYCKKENPEEYKKYFHNAAKEDLYIQLSGISYNISDWPEGINSSIVANIRIYYKRFNKRNECNLSNAAIFQIFYSVEGQYLNEELYFA